MKKSELNKLIKEELKNIFLKESNNKSKNVEQSLLVGVKKLNDIVNDYDILKSYLAEYTPEIDNGIDPKFDGFKIEKIIGKELAIETKWDGEDLICLTLQVKYSTDTISSKHGDIVIVLNVESPEEPYVKESSITILI